MILKLIFALLFNCNQSFTLIQTTDCKWEISFPNDLYEPITADKIHEYKAVFMFNGEELMSTGEYYTGLRKEKHRISKIEAVLWYQVFMQLSDKYNEAHKEKQLSDDLDSKQLPI